eukprot:gene5260-6089_t
METDNYYWGKPTASIDWCELNYAKSKYICEFYNTLSSLVITFYAVYGMYLCNMLSFSGHNAYHLKVLRQLNLTTRLNIGLLSLAIVGIGSAAFHATLLYQNQLFDELPMIFTSLIMMYILLTIGEDVTKRGYQGGVLGNTWVRHLLPYVLVGYGLVVSVWIILIQDQPKILQVSYGILIVYIVLHSFYIVKRKNLSLFGDRRKSPDVYLYIYAFVSFLTGYICWIVERQFCTDGYVINGIQLHSVWHLATGLGVFVWIQFLICSLLEAKYYSVSLHHFIGIPSVYVDPKRAE